MQCPKCGMQNPDDGRICNACGHVFERDETEKPPAKPKTSRLAIASLVLSIFSVLTFLITAALSIALGITSLCRIKKQKDRLKGKSFAVAGIAVSAASIVVYVTAIVLWGLDAPPIPDDYTIADLRSAPAGCATSYELLVSLADEDDVNQPDAPKIGLSAQDVNTIYQVNEVIEEGEHLEITEILKARADNIKQAWANGKKGRDIISKLDTFPEIADLTEPDLEAEIGFLRNLKHLVRLYRVYVCLESEQGNGQIALDELIKLDSVFRKLNVNARSLVCKLVCFAVLNLDIKAADFIVNNPQTSRQSLELLAGHFTPLKNEHTSLRNAAISEYLMSKKALDTQLGVLQGNPMLKRNSTLRLMRNYSSRWLNMAGEPSESESAELSVWPSIYFNWVDVSIDSEGKVPWIYTVYNPIGSLLVVILAPAQEKILQIKTGLQIYDDLFQIILNKRLGKEVNLKARAYSDEYIIDVEKKNIFSPGPDGKPYTEDDIKLPINPEALGLSSQ